MNNLTEMLTMVLSFLIIIIIALAFIYWYMGYKNKNPKDSKKTEQNETTKNEKEKSVYTKIPINDFLQFDKIEDNMIVQNGGNRYLMIVECDGVNYDLMSNVEKTAVETGFAQFLNTLRGPIQFYIQTKTVNISDSINNYTEKINKLKKELDQKEHKLKNLQENDGDNKEIQELSFDVKRLQNLYDYGTDVVANVKKVSQNKNVLRKYYYIVVPYYKEEITNAMFSEEELHSMIFSELYTKTQSLIRALYSCGVKGRVLTSTDIAELLYVAYNRDESEVYSLDTALRAGYDEMYSTAPDVLTKRMKALDKKIEEEAIKLAKTTIDEVKSKRELQVQEKEESFDDLVKQMAKMILEENKTYIGEEIAEASIEKIDKKATKEKGGKASEKTRKNSKK